MRSGPDKAFCGFSGADRVAGQARLGSADAPAISVQASRHVSLLYNAPALLLLIIAIADAGQLTYPDLWGHIRFGQTALAQHTVMLHDSFSYTAFGRSSAIMNG